MNKDNQSFLLGIVSAVAIIAVAALAYVLISGADIDFNNGNGGDDNVKSAKKFEECLASDKFDAKVQADQALGIQLGVNGTPATFINGYLVSGAQPFGNVKLVIDALLAGEEPTMEFLKDRETGEIIKVDMPQITEDDNVRGAKNGKITLIEFSDFECPFCSRFIPTVEQVEETYGDDVTLVFKHFPLSFHPLAKPAAVASECAGDQDKFWEMHDALFDLNAASTLSEATIKAAAVEIGLK
jgi:protein-disulfide isomerase